MIEATNIPKTALKYDIEVTEAGRVELQGPFAPGEQVTIFVFKETIDPFDDLLQATESSLDFWDNTFDDEDW